MATRDRLFEMHQISGINAASPEKNNSKVE